MDTTLTQQRNRLQSAPSSTSPPVSVGPNSNANATAVQASSLPHSQSPPVERLSAASSFANMLDGFAARVVSGDRSQSAASTPSSTHSLNGLGGGIGVGGGGGGVGGGGGGGSIASLTSIGSLGTTANAFYSSIGLAFNSLTSPITAAAAAATATAAEMSAAAMSAATAISNHLSSPNSITPPHLDDLDDDDCDDDDDDDNRHVPAPTPKKKWTEITQIVNDIRKQLSNLSSMVPTNIQFRRLSDGRVRCYFLSTPPNGWENTLLYTDINLTRNAMDENVHASGNDPSTGVGESGLAGLSGGFAPAMGGGMRMGGSPSSLILSQPSSPMTERSFMGAYQPHRQRLQWNLVLQQPIPNVGLGSGNGPTNAWSREYQLLQERKRLSSWGITSYELHKPSGKIVFPCLSDLYQCTDTGYNAGPIFPTQLRTNPQWTALDPQICPQNSDLIAYICGCDIWVTHTLSGHEKRLTYAHYGRRSMADDPLSAGVPSYVMQEEFSRYQGYWWQPQSEDGVYRIVYEEVDESDVCLYTFPSSQMVPGEMEEYRFPRTGSANAKTKLKMVQFMLNESLQISDLCTFDLPYSLFVVFPWLEYIVRVGWTPDSKYVWFQGLNRRQQRLDLVLLPLDNFCETYNSSTSSPSGSVDHSWKSPYNKISSPPQVIYSEQSTGWINVHDLLYFLEITPNTVTFLWASEETGFRHLYLVTSSLSTTILNGNAGDAVMTSAGPSSASASDQCQQSTRNNETTNSAVTTATAATTTTTTTRSMSPMSPADVIMDSMDGGNNVNNATPPIMMDTQIDFHESFTLQPRIINKVALTSGEWEVLGRNLWVDKAQQLVYFLGLRDTPLEKHLYVVSLQRPEHIRLLTEPGYSYLVEFDETCQLMLQVYCNIQSLPSCKLMRVIQTCQNGGVNGIQISLVGYLHEGGKADPQYCPQIYWPQLPSGEIVYAMVFKPHNFRLGVKYPTVLNVYGGPEVQTVNNTFKGKHQLRMHMLAAQGYCVVCIDSRGSRHRGRRFENHIRCRMGQVELTDQVDGLRILADQLGYIDMNRVAIHGWSYGGYLSLMGLAQYPEIFKIAIAGAPVTNWEYYDTGYTERYMDLPEYNKRGYTAGSVLNYVHKFPEEEHRLLLIHGIIDENVHFSHTTQLISALIKANKPYDLHVFPDERHSLRNLESNKNYETKLLSFLQNL